MKNASVVRELTICERSTLRALLGRAPTAVLIVYVCASQPCLRLAAVQKQVGVRSSSDVEMENTVAVVMSYYNRLSLEPPPLGVGVSPRTPSTRTASERRSCSS